MRKTDHEALDLMQLNIDVIRGNSNGKIIWQPRMSAWFDDRDFRGEAYEAPFTGLSYEDCYRKLHCSDRLYWHFCCFDKILPSSVREYTLYHSEMEYEKVIETPVGRVSTIMAKSTSNFGEMPRKHWATSEEDLKIFIWLEEHTEWKYNHEAYLKGLSASKEFGMPITMMPRVNIQNLSIDLMGAEGHIYALYDYEETVEKLFSAMSESQARMIEQINLSPIEAVNFGDNLHYKMLPPELFLKYVLPEYQKRNELLHKCNKFTSSHWDGDTKLLLPYAKDCGLDAIEAITPLPQGDVTIPEMKEALGDEVFLMDGIPAILFEEQYPIEMLEEQVRLLIELFAPKLILGISDEISSLGTLKRVAHVGKMVDDYNAGISK